MLGRILITLATLLYGIAPLFADLNATHVLNPEWTPHSRVHMVWLLGTNSSIAALALWLLWSRAQRVLAAILGLCVMAGFWIAVATSPLYGGALSDARGIDTKILGIEGNALIFAIIVILLVAGIAMGESHDDA